MNASGQPGSQRFRTVLLDDDEEDRAHFRSLIRRHPSIEIVGEASHLKDALQLVIAGNADVLALDTRIDGRSVLDECRFFPSSVRLLFLTREHENALRAFELDAIDYLIKPVDSARLAETVRRMLRIEWARPSAPAPSSATVLIPFERGRRGTPLDEVCLIQAFGNYTRVVLSGGKSEIVLRSLAKWERILPMPPFLRVHRNTLVHSGRVRGLEETGNGHSLKVEDVDEPVAISRRCLTEVREAVFAKAP